MSSVVKKERCPKCAELGKDRSGDNLVTYSDGHSYCFACGYTLNGDGAKLTRYFNRVQPPPLVEHRVFLPSDCSFDYPIQAVEWVGQYEIHPNTLRKHRVMWSQDKEQLVFPIIGGNNEFLCYVARNFNREGGKPKWISFGDLRNTFHIIGDKSGSVVLVEDIVSAIKVSAHMRAMPVFGSNIGLERFKRLSRMMQESSQCIIWLDPDMRPRMVKESALGSSVGLNMRTIFSEKDPKEHTYDEIMEILD